MTAIRRRWHMRKGNRRMSMCLIEGEDSELNIK